MVSRKQLPRRKPVRRTRATQGRQHVELPGLQIVRAECVRSDAVQVAGQPADAGKHLHRRNVQVRTFATPGLDDGVDLVPGWLAGHTRSLDRRGT